MKKKLFKKVFMIMILIIMFIAILCVFETKVYSSSYRNGQLEESEMRSKALKGEIVGAIGIEAFVTIHMNAFVFFPLAKILFKEKSKAGLIIFNVIRIVFLLYFDFFVTPDISTFDFMFVFLGAFLIVPMVFIIDRAARREKDTEEPRYKFKYENQAKKEYQETEDIRKGPIDNTEDESYEEEYMEEDEDSPIKNY